MTTNPAILALDVGNTRIKLAWLTDPVAQPGSGLAECLKTITVPNPTEIPWAQLSSECQAAGILVTRSLLSGSHQELLEELQAHWPAEFPEPRTIRTAIELPLVLEVDHPAKLGVDRALNALAVNQIRSEASPAIIVDAGTAITIDVVGPSGAFLGGAILPGYELEARALHDYTSLLPFLPMEDIIGRFPPVIGRHTQAALHSGLIWGQVGAVNEIVSRMKASLQSESTLEPLFFLTGGAAPLLEPYLRERFRHQPQLTLQGLACVPA